MNEHEPDIRKKVDMGGDIESARIKHISQLMLDLKQGMMEDFNVNYEPKVLNDKTAQVFSCSRRTKEQADKARVYIEFFYTFVMKSVSTQEDTPHDGVDNVYNPLQVIRNRKIRKKYGDKLKDFHVVRPPVIAIRDFSQRTSKFPWYVDIMEKSSDLIWRTNHWDELRKADKTLWFGQEKHRRNHIHGDSVHSLDSFPEDSSFEEGSTRKHRHHHRLSRNSNLRLDFKESNGSRALLSRLSRGSNKKQDSAENVVHNNDNSKMVVPKIIYETPTDYVNGKSAINEVKIGSIKRSDTEQDMSQDLGLSSYESLEKPRKDSSSSNFRYNSISSSNEEETELAEDEGSEEARRLMLDHYNALKYFKCSFKMLKHKEYILDDLLPCSVERKHDQLLYDFVNFDDDLQKVHVLLDEYQVKLEENIEMVSDWKTRILSDYLNRVSSLISSSDRFLSDINTTLTLRMKVLQENVDKMGVIRHIQRRSWNRLLYRALEIFIVCCLWIIWIIFIILRSFQIALLFIYKIVRWALL